MASKKRITKRELDKILRNHLLYLKGGGENLKANLENTNLKGFDLKEANLYGANLALADLRGADLQGTQLSGAQMWGANLEGANLDGANLYRADLRGVNLSNAFLGDANLKDTNFNGTILIGADYDYNQLSENQKQVAIFTEKELEQRQSLEEKDKIIYEKEEKLETVSEEKTQEMKEGFEKLKEEYQKEEDAWFKWVRNLFIALIIVLSLIGLYLIWCDDNNLYKELSILPIILILSTFLYFCVHNYSKAKNLRIENQNKLAVIDGYKGLLAESDIEGRLDYFLPNISNVLFSKVTNGKDKNMPLDEIVAIVKAITDKSK